MSTAIHTSNGHAPPRIPQAGAERSPRGLQSVLEHLELPYTFLDIVLRYLLLVLPQAGREMAHWRDRAAEIPSPVLRHQALQSLRKRGNIEGAALFATLAPRRHRHETVRALVAFQTAYNYLDALSELPSQHPVANADQLHQALLVALHPGAAHPDYYAHNPDRDDGGYLTDILTRCNRAFAGLPSYTAIAPAARSAAARILDFQTLNLSESQGGHDALKRWATETTPRGSDLSWWEGAAAAGSSLAVHALIAAAADRDLDAADARQIGRAYFPWIGALHSLLDSLVDRCEDQQQGRRSLLDYYASGRDATIRLAALGARARDAAERLPSPHAHRVMLTAMCSYYISAPESDTPDARLIAKALTDTLGIPFSVAVLMFRSKRFLHNRAHDIYA